MARIFPPAKPLDRAPAGSIFFRLLRPELVKEQKNSLSSDALSSWQNNDPNTKEMNEDITRVTLNLLRERCKEFSEKIWNKNQNFKHIDLSLSIIKQPSFVGVPFKDNIIISLNEKGINTRYLGKIVLNLRQSRLQGKHKNKKMEDFLFGLMTARYKFWGFH